MALDLPRTLAAYFDAQNAHDIDAMAVCFAPDAHVRDEGRDYQGIAEVRGWLEATSARYRIQAKPLSLDEANGAKTVLVRVSGNFPGSPIDLSFHFGIRAEGLIATLEIK